MNELDIYGIKVDAMLMRAKLLGLLLTKLNEVNNGLQLTTLKEARIQLLVLKESIEWIIPILQKGGTIGDEINT